MISPVEIFEDMKLQVAVKTTVACSVLIRGRYWHDNQVKFFTETLTPTDLTGDANTFTPIQFPKGQLLNLDVSTTTPSIQRGQMAVSCGLLLQGQASNPFIRLMSGYVTSFKGIDLSSGFEDLLSGRGFIGFTALVSGAMIISTKTLHHVLSVDVTVATSAVAGNRYVYLATDDGDQGVFVSMANTAQAASKTMYYSFSTGTTTEVVKTLPGGEIRAVEPLSSSMFLQEGNDLSVAFVNGQVGDAFSSGFVVTEQWLKN